MISFQSSLLVCLFVCITHRSSLIALVRTSFNLFTSVHICHTSSQGSLRPKQFCPEGHVNILLSRYCYTLYGSNITIVHATLTRKQRHSRELFRGIYGNSISMLACTVVTRKTIHKNFCKIPEYSQETAFCSTDNKACLFLSQSD